jgi:hypothetical protein
VQEIDNSDADRAGSDCERCEGALALAAIADGATSSVVPWMCHATSCRSPPVRLVYVPPLPSRLSQRHNAPWQLTGGAPVINQPELYYHHDYCCCSCSCRWLRAVDLAPNDSILFPFFFFFLSIVAARPRASIERRLRAPEQAPGQALGHAQRRLRSCTYEPDVIVAIIVGATGVLRARLVAMVQPTGQLRGGLVDAVYPSPCPR